MSKSTHIKIISLCINVDSLVIINEKLFILLFNFKNRILKIAKMYPCLKIVLAGFINGHCTNEKLYEKITQNVYIRN